MSSESKITISFLTQDFHFLSKQVSFLSLQHKFLIICDTEFSSINFKIFSFFTKNAKFSCVLQRHVSRLAAEVAVIQYGLHLQNVDRLKVGYCGFSLLNSTSKFFMVSLRKRFCFLTLFFVFVSFFPGHILLHLSCSRKFFINSLLNSEFDRTSLCCLILSDKSS